MRKRTSRRRRPPARRAGAVRSRPTHPDTRSAAKPAVERLEHADAERSGSAPTPAEGGSLRHELAGKVISLRTMEPVCPCLRTPRRRSPAGRADRRSARGRGPARHDAGRGGHRADRHFASCPRVDRAVVRIGVVLRCDGGSLRPPAAAAGGPRGIHRCDTRPGLGVLARALLGPSRSHAGWPRTALACGWRTRVAHAPRRRSTAEVDHGASRRRGGLRVGRGDSGARLVGLARGARTRCIRRGLRFGAHLLCAAGDCLRRLLGSRLRPGGRCPRRHDRRADRQAWTLVATGCGARARRRTARASREQCLLVSARAGGAGRPRGSGGGRGGQASRRQAGVGRSAAFLGHPPRGRSARGGAHGGGRPRESGAGRLQASASDARVSPRVRTAVLDRLPTRVAGDLCRPTLRALTIRPCGRTGGRARPRRAARLSPDSTGSPSHAR